MPRHTQTWYRQLSTHPDHIALISSVQAEPKGLQPTMFAARAPQFEHVRTKKTDHSMNPTRRSNATLISASLTALFRSDVGINQKLFLMFLQLRISTIYATGIQSFADSTTIIHYAGGVWLKTALIVLSFSLSLYVMILVPA